MSLGALLAKDARLLLRNRALLAALLLYPLLLAGVLAAAFQEAPVRLSVVVVDDDAESTLDVGDGQIVTTEDVLASTRAFVDVRRVNTEAQAVTAVRRGEADAALLIPRGFLADLATLGGSATLRLVVDESDAVRASVARNAVQGAIDSFVESVVQRKIDDVLRLLNLTTQGGTTRVLFVDVEILGIDRAIEYLTDARGSLPADSQEARKINDVISFLDFTKSVMGNSERYLTTTALPVEVTREGLTQRDTRLSAIALPGALVLGVFWTGALAAALLAARERESGVDRRLRAAPGARWQSLLSKTLAALVAGLVPAAILLILGIAFLGARVADPATALLVLVMSALAAAALGGLAAGVARATAGAALVAVLALLPMLLLGGLFYPVAYMPAPAQAVARVLPITLATDALRGALLRASPLSELAPALGGLAAFALLASAAAGAMLARRAP